MVSVVDCHAGVLGSNPGGPKDFPLGITSLLSLASPALGSPDILEHKPYLGVLCALKGLVVALVD